MVAIVTPRATTLKAHTTVPANQDIMETAKTTAKVSNNLFEILYVVSVFKQDLDKGCRSLQNSYMNARKSF